jgi:hypothetical protein
MMVLYHGTSTGYLKQILRDGLRPESSYKGYLCYTDEAAIADHHAQFMAEWDAEYVEHPCHPVIFAIPFERFDRSAFCLEENWIDLGPSAGRAVRMDMTRREWTWETLLTETGAVGYAATMPVGREDILNSMEMAA